MAKTAAFGSDPTASAKSAELKKALQKLVTSIFVADDYTIETIDQATDALCSLKQLKLRKRSPSLMLRETVSCPDEFRCPISRELMRDPVIIASGQTYDRPFIQKWLKDGNRTCPQSQQVLSHTLLVPNLLALEMISQWCKSQGVELPAPPVDCSNEEEAVTDAERAHFLSSLEKMSGKISDQKEAAKELRLLTKRTPSFRALFGEIDDAIPQLLSPLSGAKSDSAVIELELQEDVITTLLNLSIHDNNKKLVAETPMAIPVLIEALKSGTIETRSNAAAALFTLSALDANKIHIGKSGAIKPLINLLDEAHPLAMKDVASAIFSLCIVHDNKARAVRDGAVEVILKKIMSGVHVDELLAILAVLSGHSRAVDEMAEFGAVPCLLQIIRESTCERNKENCIAVLHTIFFTDRSQWKAIREEEATYGTISKLARDGTSRAKRKASGILERLKSCLTVKRKRAIKPLYQLAYALFRK